MIMLSADLLELKANPKRPPSARSSKPSWTRAAARSRRPWCQTGTLRVGDVIVVGETYGKVRALENALGKRITKAGPSSPAVVLGLADVPQAGDILRVVADEKTARAMVEERKAASAAGRRQRQGHPGGPVRADPGRPDQGTADHPQDGRVGLARRDHPRPAAALDRRSADQRPARGRRRRHRQRHHARRGVQRDRRGLQHEGDRHGPARGRGREGRRPPVRHHLQAHRRHLGGPRGMLEPVEVETVEGRAEVRKIFRVGKVAVIAGCYVTDGRIVRGRQREVWRGGKVITTDRIESLRRLKDDVREVATNFECGIGLAGSNDLVEGDIIECFTQQMVSRAAG
jgi:translation initiation factor IF-2